MKLRLTLSNGPSEFGVALDNNMKVLNELLDFGIVSDIFIRTRNKKQKIEIMSRDKIKEYLIYENKKYLKNLFDLDDAPLGYMSHYYFLDKFGNVGDIVLGFGTPSISGKDSVFIELHNDNENFKIEYDFLLNIGLGLLKRFILVFNPIEADLSNSFYSNLLNPGYNSIGVVNYFRSDFFEEIDVQNINVIKEKLEFGKLYFLKEEKPSKLKEDVIKFTRNVKIAKKN